MVKRDSQFAVQFPEVMFSCLLGSLLFHVHILTAVILV